MRLLLGERSDAHFGHAPLGDVVVGADPVIAAADRAVDHLDRMTVRPLDDGTQRLAARHGVEQFGAVTLGVAVEAPAGNARGDDLAQGAAGFHHLAREPVHFEVAVVADHQALRTVEHDDPLRHVVERRRQQSAVGVEPSVGEGADETHPEHGHGGAGDRDRERPRREREGGDGARWIGHDLHRAHGGEMMGDDRQGQQDGRECRRPHGVAPRGDEKRGHAKQDAERDRRDDQAGPPGHPPGQLDRPHAGVMHAGDAAAHHGAAERRAPALGEVDRDGEAAGGHQRRGDEGEGRQADVVSDRDAGIVGEHGDEVGRPYPAPGGGAGRNDPGGARPAGRGARAIEQADRREARQETDDAGDDHQAPVVLACQAVEDAEHAGSSALNAVSASASATNFFFSSTRVAAGTLTLPGIRPGRP